MTGWIQQRINTLTAELMANDHFLSALETAINTKGYVERKLQTVLHSMSLASRLDVDALGKKLEDAERRLRQMGKRFEALQAELEALRAAAAKAAAPPEKPAAAPAEAVAAPAPAPAPVEAAPAPAAPASTSEGKCVRCGKSFEKKTFNQRFCSSACRSGV